MARNGIAASSEEHDLEEILAMPRNSRIGSNKPSVTHSHCFHLDMEKSVVDFENTHKFFATVSIFFVSYSLWTTA